MDIYLPIANLSVDAFVIVLLGGLVGILSGMFGVGGGFLTTPLLIFYGIPPHSRSRFGINSGNRCQYFRRSSPYAAERGRFSHGSRARGWGIFGTFLGTVLFQFLQNLGQIDTVINVLYVLMLTGIGGLMAKESWESVRALRSGNPLPARKRRHHPLVANLPMPWRFYRSGLYISPIAPFLLGLITGILTMLLGVGGGFIMVPAMLYLLGMGAQVVVGTSLFQILFVTIASTMMHSMTTRAVDIVLAALLLVGSVTGAQLGAKFAHACGQNICVYVLPYSGAACCRKTGSWSRVSNPTKFIRFSRYDKIAQINFGPILLFCINDPDWCQHANTGTRCFAGQGQHPG